MLKPSDVDARVILYFPLVRILENFPNKKLKENQTEQRDFRKEIKDDKPAPNFGPMKHSSSPFNGRSYAELGRYLLFGLPCVVQCYGQALVCVEVSFPQDGYVRSWHVVFSIN